MNDGLVPETVQLIRPLYAAMAFADSGPATVPVAVIAVPPIDVAFETVTQLP